MNCAAAIRCSGSAAGLRTLFGGRPVKAHELHELMADDDLGGCEVLGVGKPERFLGPSSSVHDADDLLERDLREALDQMLRELRPVRVELTTRPADDVRHDDLPRTRPPNPRGPDESGTNGPLLKPVLTVPGE